MKELIFDLISVYSRIFTNQQILYSPQSKNFNRIRTWNGYGASKKEKHNCQLKTKFFGTVKRIFVWCWSFPHSSKNEVFVDESRECDSRVIHVSEITKGFFKDPHSSVISIFVILVFNKWHKPKYKTLLMASFKIQ
jgi:hypothetical protein